MNWCVELVCVLWTRGEMFIIIRIRHTHSAYTPGYKQFKVGMFQLADQWTLTTKSSEYVGLVHILCVYVCVCEGEWCNWSIKLQIGLTLRIYTLTHTHHRHPTSPRYSFLHAMYAAVSRNVSVRPKKKSVFIKAKPSMPILGKHEGGGV
jgi:hypothetical protein